MNALVSTFAQFFDVMPAITSEHVRSVLQLRYQVYCIETAFEDKEQHRDGLEQDEFDSRAVHSLLVHKPSGMIAGTVRLVLPDNSNSNAEFPIEKHCSGLVRPSVATSQRSQVAEISRFCISKEFKRRMAEPHTLWGSDVSEEEMAMAQRRLIPHITVGLFLAITRMSAQHGIKYWYAVMEPSLLRLLKRFGIHFDEIGPTVDYHGIRQPCFASAEAVLRRIHDESHDAWELITEAGSLWPSSKPQRREAKSLGWLNPMLNDHVFAGS